MAGINNNLGNFNLRNSLLKNNSKKPIVKTETKEADVKPEKQQQVPTKKVSINDLNKDALLVNNGIKIIRPGQQIEQPKVNKFAEYAYSSMKDYGKDYYAGKFKPGDRISITEDYGNYIKITVVTFPEDGGPETIRSTRI